MTMKSTLIVVDDIVTTGATMAAVTARLGEANMQVAGAAVVAATQLRKAASTGLRALPPRGTRLTDRHVLRSPNEG
jgi:orotate phosphoribosyltransferase